MTWWVPGDEALAPAQNLELARFLKQLPKTHSPLCPARNPLLLTWLTGGSRRGELGLPRAQHGGAQAGGQPWLFPPYRVLSKAQHMERVQ